MSLALLTRGYVCQRSGAGAQIYGPGPSIVDIAPITPRLSAAAARPSPAIAIVGSEIEAPTVTGTVQQPATIDPPTIVGGNSLVPTITGDD